MRPGDPDRPVFGRRRRKTGDVLAPEPAVVLCFTATGLAADADASRRLQARRGGLAAALDPFVWGREA